MVFVSVKPVVVPNVLGEVKAKAAGKLFISVAMGVTIEQIEKVVSHSTALSFSYLNSLHPSVSVDFAVERKNDPRDAKHSGVGQPGLLSVRPRLEGDGLRC